MGLLVVFSVTFSVCITPCYSKQPGVKKTAKKLLLRDEPVLTWNLPEVMSPEWSSAQLLRAIAQSRHRRQYVPANGTHFIGSGVWDRLTDAKQMNADVFSKKAIRRNLQQGVQYGRIRGHSRKEFPLDELYKGAWRNETVNIRLVHNMPSIAAPLQKFVDKTGLDLEDMDFYYAPKDGKSYGVHMDTVDTLLICAAGSKRFRIFSREIASVVAVDVVLHPGDALWVPALTFHEGIGQKESSLLASIGFQLPFPHLESEVNHLYEILDYVVMHRIRDNFAQQSMRLAHLIQDDRDYAVVLAALQKAASKSERQGRSVLSWMGVDLFESKEVGSLTPISNQNLSQHDSDQVNDIIDKLHTEL